MDTPPLERLVAEHAALREKQLALRKFVTSESVNGLSREDVQLLRDQLQHMTGYALTLNQRIDRYRDRRSWEITDV